MHLHVCVFAHVCVCVVTLWNLCIICSARVSCFRQAPFLCTPWLRAVVLRLSLGVSVNRAAAWFGRLLHDYRTWVQDFGGLCQEVCASIAGTRLAHAHTLWLLGCGFAAPPQCCSKCGPLTVDDTTHCYQRTSTDHCASSPADRGVSLPRLRAFRCGPCPKADAKISSAEIASALETGLTFTIAAPPVFLTFASPSQENGMFRACFEKGERDV